MAPDLPAKILHAMLTMYDDGEQAVHAYPLGKRVQELYGGTYVSHGALYLACSRLGAAGQVGARWERQEETGGERARRRLYWLTPAGREAALASVQ